MDVEAETGDTHRRSPRRAPVANPIGVAISGGGHRAACWGAGALLGLTDASLHDNVVSVASVSGGSLANAAVAQSPGYETLDADRLEGVLRPWIRTWAREGLFFEGPLTDGYVGKTLTLVVLSLVATVTAVGAALTAARALPWWVCAAIGLVVAGGGALGVGKLPAGLRGRLPATSLRALTVAAIAGGIGFGLVLWLATDSRPGWLQAVAVVLSLAAAGVLWSATVRSFGRRSEVVDDALADSLLRSPAGPLQLVDLQDRAVHHVFCSSNLTTGDHFYLSPQLLSGFLVGAAAPHPELSVATAVQCSACLPGAFVARPFAAGDLFESAPADAVEPIRLSDGGVYDNMADQWEFGFGRRRTRFRREHSPIDLDWVQQAAEFLIVVNASGSMQPKRLHEPFRRPRHSGIAEELASLTGAKNVIYDVSTSVRRSYLVSAFSTPSAAIRGALVHITQSPYGVAEDFLTPFDRTDEAEARAERAARALRVLDRLGTLDGYGPTREAAKNWWATQAGQSSGVPTTLGSIGQEAAAGLLHHAYTLTRINLHVICGLGTLPEPGDAEAVFDPWRRRRFDQLVADACNDAVAGRSETTPFNPDLGEGVDG